MAVVIVIAIAVIGFFGFKLLGGGGSGAKNDASNKAKYEQLMKDSAGAMKPPPGAPAQGGGMSGGAISGGSAGR